MTEPEDGSVGVCGCEGGAVCAKETGDTACADFCAEAHGGCDPLTACVNVAEAARCGSCPDGYLAGADGRCAPTLLGLGLSDGILRPELEPGRVTYEIVVPVYIQSLILTPTAAPGANVSIRGAAVAPGSSWTSPDLALGDNELEILLEREGQPNTGYTLNVVRGAAPVAYLKASNTGAGDEFGYHVALSADGSTLAVGAQREASSASGVGADPGDSQGAYGAVYVFVRSGEGWSEQAYIKASNASVSSSFGAALALSEDGDTLVIGATGDSSDATGVDGDQGAGSAVGSGAVYVFTRTGSSWSQQAYIKASTSSSYKAFGASVALSSDGDTLAVGATNEPIGGAVYLFIRAGGSWSQQTYVQAPGADGQDLFGASVALSFDGNTLAVGAPAEDSDASGVDGSHTNNDAEDSGAVYVFTRSESSWAQQAYVKASNTGALDRFGRSVSLSGDGNTLAVGAPNEDSSSKGIGGYQNNDDVPDSGAVYVLVRSDGKWEHSAYIKAFNPRYDGRQFGQSVSLAGDGDTLAVGAHLESSSDTGIGGAADNDDAKASGAAYVFVRRGASWSQDAYVKASNTDAGDWFGYSVALCTDGSTLAVGAPRESSSATGVGGDPADNGMTTAGAVYLYR